MANSFIGVGAVYGVSATLSPVTSNCIGTIAIQSYRFKPGADKFDINQTSGVVGRIAANKSETLTIEGIFISATSLSDAQTQAARTPEVNDIVSIADTVDTEIAGKWAVSEAEKGGEVKGAKTVSLTLERYPDSSAFNGTTLTAIA